MAIRGVTTAKPATQIRAIMEQATGRCQSETGKRIPAPRRSYTYTQADVTVVVHGTSLGHGPTAEYWGPLGHWYASINKWVGKPWQA